MCRFRKLQYEVTLKKRIQLHLNTIMVFSMFCNEQNLRRQHYLVSFKSPLLANKRHLNASDLMKFHAFLLHIINLSIINGCTTGK